MRHLSSGTADFSESLSGLSFRLKRLGGKENFSALNSTRGHFRDSYSFHDSGERLLNPLL